MGFWGFEVMDYVRQSASQYNAPDDLLGHGIPDLDLAKDIALSLDEYLRPEFTMYPNPVADELYIQFPEDDINAELNFYNQLGQRILNTNVTSTFNAVDVSFMAPGLFILELNFEGTTKTYKFIKQ